MWKQILYKDRPMRLSFSQLDSLITVLGWSASSVENKDYPYNTYYMLLCPVREEHINSDEMKKFMYACGYYDIEIDFQNKQIKVCI